MVNYGRVPPIYGGNTGTVDVSQYGRTGSATTNPDFFRLYTEQLFTQNFDVLFGDEGVNNSVFGDTGIFGTMPSDTSSLFGGADQTTLPSDVSGLSTQTGGNQYLELIARSNLVGKKVEAINPLTKQKFTGTVKDISLERGILLINIDGIQVPPENLLKVTS